MTNFIPVRVAVLDLYNGEPNEGMRSIGTILDRFSKFIECSFFDVRQKNEVPDLSYDIYISSGGPGCPLPAGDEWEEPFYALWDKLLAHNADADNKKKYAFLICHSFQMMAHHLGFGVVSERHSPVRTKRLFSSLYNVYVLSHKNNKQKRMNKKCKSWYYTSS